LVEDETIRYVEFVDGHREEDVGQDKAAEKVEDAIEKGQYVAIKKKDGSTKTGVEIEQEAKKEAKGDKTKKKKLTKKKVKKELKDAKRVEQIKPVTPG